MSKLKNRIRKIVSLMLALLLCAVPFTAAYAVTYPEGVSKESCETAIPKIDLLLTKLPGLADADLSEALYSAVLTDDTLNMLFSSVYGAMAENSSSLSVVGVDLSPAALSAALKGFGNVSQTVSGCADLAAVVKASEKFTWGVKTKERFGEAVAAMFSPFNTLLYTVLCSGSASIAPLVSIKGADGYQNAIVPILNTLGCPSVMTTEAFASAAASDKSAMMKNIVAMLFSAVDKLLEKPVEGVCTVLPGAAWFVDNGKLTESIGKLVEPLSLRLGLISIPGVSSLLSSAAKLEDTADLSTLLKNVDLSALTGGKNISLPEINLSDLAACGEVSGDEFIADKGAAFITLARWLLEAVRKNEAALPSTLGEASSVVSTLLKKSDDELIRLLIDLLITKKTLPANAFVWSYPAVTPAVTAYTPTLTRDDYVKVLNGLDPLLDEIAAESDPDATIYDTVAPAIFSDNIASMLCTAVYSALGGKDTAPLFSLLGLDVTPAGVAARLRSSYPSAASQLAKYSSWDKVNASALRFGFRDGDKDGFTKAVAAMLEPFLPMLGYVLAEKDLTLFDTVTLPGSDGYNTAVIPLLEALGCPAETVKSYDVYKATASSNGVTDILVPVVNMLDSLCHRPVAVACAILPNIMYFLSNDGLKNCVNNLLFPVTQFLASAGLGDLMPGGLTGAVPELSVNDLIKKLTASADLSLKLPDVDLNKLASYGTPTEMTSKRTLNGVPAQYTYIVSDAPAVLLTALRFLVNTLSMEENADVLSGFMSGIMSSGDQPEAGSPDMMGMYVGNVTEKFKGMTTDEIIEWLYNLLFRETPKVEQTENDVYVPADIREVKDPVDTAKVLIAVFAVIVLLVFILKFLYDKGYLDGLLEKIGGGREKKPKKQKKASGGKKAAKQKKQKTEKTKKTGAKTEAPASSVTAAAAAAAMTEPVTFSAKTVPAAAQTVSSAAAAVPAEAPARTGRAAFLDPLSDMDAKYIPAAAPARPAAPAPEQKKETPAAGPRLDRSALLMPLSEEDVSAVPVKKKAQPKAVRKEMPEIYSRFAAPGKQPEKKPAIPDAHSEKKINPAFIDEVIFAENEKADPAKLSAVRRRKQKADKKAAKQRGRIASADKKGRKK